MKTSDRVPSPGEDDGCPPNKVVSNKNEAGIPPLGSVGSLFDQAIMPLVLHQFDELPRIGL